MLKCYLKILIFAVGLFEILNAKPVVDCRVITGSAVGECNPYGKKLLYVKEITCDTGRKKLIFSKSVHRIYRKHHIKVVSVDDMLKKYIKVDTFVVYKGLKSKHTSTNKSVKPIVSKAQTAKPKIIKQGSIDRPVLQYAYYTVIEGDTLSKIAKKLNLKLIQLTVFNGLTTSATLHIGQKLKVLLKQKIVDALSHASYTVEPGDTLLSIAKMFKLSAKDIATFNHITDATRLRPGKVLKLPLPYIIAQVKVQKHKKKESHYRLSMNTFGSHKLRVTATAYTSHGKQTDKTPFLAAWNNRLRPGMKIIAVSRDLLTRYGMRNGTKVRIGGLRGIYRVRDKMNRRYRKRIDIYMGLNRRRALKWGKRSVMIYW